MSEQDELDRAYADLTYRFHAGNTFDPARCAAFSDEEARLMDRYPGLRPNVSHQQKIEAGS